MREWSLSYYATSFVLCYVLEFVYCLLPSGAMLERDYSWILDRPYPSDFDHGVYVIVGIVPCEMIVCDVFCFCLRDCLHDVLS